MTVKEALLNFIRIWSDQNKIYSQQCIVKSVDSNKRTCVCTPVDGGADLLNVRIEADLTVNTDDDPINSSPKGFFVIPKVGSLVIVSYLSKTDSYVSVWTEISDIIVISDLFKFNDGSLGGLIKINDLVIKLNNLVTEIKSLKTALDTHVHTGVTTGAGTSGTPVPFVANFTNFNKNDFENDKIIH
jgi:hypothetical protein